MIHSVLSNWVSLVILGATSFLMTPVLVHGLGDFQYGMWVLVGSILDYYEVLDLGIRATLHRFVGLLNGIRERVALDETIATAIVISFGISLLVAVSTFGLVVLLPDFFVFDAPSKVVFHRLIVLLGLSVAVLFPARALGAYLCGLQRFDLYNLGVIVPAIVRAGLIVTAVQFGYGVLMVGAVTLATALLSFVVNWNLVRWADPEVSLGWGRATRARLRELATFGFYAFLARIGDSLRFFTDPLVIGSVLSISLITPFSVAARLMDHFKSVVAGLVGPLLPQMSALEGQAKPGDLRRLFLHGSKASALLALCVASLLLLNGQALLRVWLGERFLISYPLLLILTAGYIVTLAQYPSMVLIYALNRHRPLGWWTLVEGIANLVLSIYWARKYGLVGVALGTAVPMLVTGLVVQPWYVLRLTGVSARRYLREALARPALACVIFLSVTTWTLQGETQPGVGYLASSLAWQTALFAAIAYGVGLAPLERQLVLERCKRFVGLALGNAGT